MRAQESIADIAVASGADSDTAERSLRVWTPILLRTVLGIAVILMAAGVIEAARGPAVRAEGAAIATLGLLALTLVPLLRVATCFVFFIRERDLVFAAMTAYVFALLAAGVALGRMG